MQQHGGQYFVHRLPLRDPGVGSNGQNSPFSEHGYATYQINGMKKPQILSLHTPSTPGVGPKVKTLFLLKVAM